MNRKQSITLREGHPAINVKVYENLNSPLDNYTDEQRAQAWEWTVEGFWRTATDEAHKRGYTGVFAEGRSGGWLVPYNWSKGKPRHGYSTEYAQGPEIGYPVYPDVLHNHGDRERFRAFERTIRQLLANVRAEYKHNLALVEQDK
jgi:hypothetical protein